VICYVCEFLSSRIVSLTTGVTNWKNIRHLAEPEGSIAHKEYIFAFGVFGRQNTGIDKILAVQI